MDLFCLKITKIRFIFLISLFVLIFQNPLHATHIRAGDITAVRTGNLTYCFTISLYTFSGSNADSQTLNLNFGDGSPVQSVPRISKVNIGNETEVGVYRVCHTFAGAGNFRIFFVEENRNAGVVNMSASVNTPFCVETLITIDPLLGLNNSPVLRVPPIDVACPRQRFIHNPGAFDPDGDSLSFRLGVPKQNINTFVGNYFPPNIASGGNTEANNAPAIFSINPITGDLVWDAPLLVGEYNVAFFIDEWRNGERIGWVMRDMQIIVKNDCNNRRPELTVPNVCIEADEDAATTSNIIQRTITATDPDTAPTDEIRITSSSTQGVYDNAFFNIVANFQFVPPQFANASGTFRWDTRCEHVRDQPYIVVFKAEDQPIGNRRPKLTDVKSMLITVKGPKIKNVTAVPAGNRMNLSWGNYALECPTFTPAQRSQMTISIWRREGCGSEVPCLQSPKDVGYQKITTTDLPLTATTFQDIGPLALGLIYNYVIVVNYPQPKGGESQASVPVCVSLPINSPVLTKVSVDVTNLTTATPNGTIEINWLRPSPLGGNISGTFAPPYRYELYKTTDLTGATGLTLINTQTDATGNNINFSYVDNPLNTKDTQFLYKIRWFYGANVAGQPSDTASSVRLTTTPANNSIILTWDYKTPWSNQNRIHEIYRGLLGTPKASMIKIGEVLVGQRRFVDNGTFNNECLDPKKVYSYYVKTKGSYSNPTLIPEPVNSLLNDSQINSASPIDNTPPPPPVLSLEPLICDNFNPAQIRNILRWTKVTQAGTNSCQTDVAFYKLYYQSEEGRAFEPIPNPPMVQPFTDTTFTHTTFPDAVAGLLSQAGCYYVTATDASGNESVASNVVCQDNCILFELPNVFTPNGDNKNDLFKPIRYRYVLNVEFRVFSRLGTKVYQGNRGVEIDWDGKDNNGNDMADGVYYYEADVTFKVRNPATAKKTYKGWVQIGR
ncbi:MAG: gliding motility-associated C-terminal domain-containing protein [Bacteroidetes bacterium]|nr:MAG: gliding motility-associated C-terminal domain-containing protein [Bacteroidota bacterium]